MTEDHFIFPLGTVLFPGGALPLKIFEQRYIEMTKACLKDALPFGVCLISEGAEVGAPAVPESVGCLATIERWDMQAGLFHLLARGGERFRLLETRAAKNGLLSGTIERMAPDPPGGNVDSACREVLKLIIRHVGEATIAPPHALDDAAWVGFRLAEVLPLDMRVKQELLELCDAGERLARLRQMLVERGLVVKDKE